MSERSDQFDRFKPELTDADTYISINNDYRVISFSGKTVADEQHQTQAIVIKFLFGNGNTQTMIFDSYAFGVLSQLSEAVDLVNAAMTEANAATKN